MRFNRIHIIYNPNSTGPSTELAKSLYQDLKEHNPQAKVERHATKYQGHAEKIAFDAAQASSRPLLVSVSGDGGYHEVVNGAITAQKQGANPVCAVLPAGNANDHHRMLSSKPVVSAIKSGKTKRTDLLQMKVETAKGKSFIQYAHSYIGFGLTPVVAAELNKTSLNALKELWIVLTEFIKYRPFKIKNKSGVLYLDSIVFANIGQMAKVITLAKTAKPDDGLFEVVLVKHQHRFNLFRKMVESVVSSAEEPQKYSEYEFQMLKSMPVQLDGEVIRIKRGTKVNITSEHQILRTIF